MNIPYWSLVIGLVIFIISLLLLFTRIGRIHRCARGVALHQVPDRSQNQALVFMRRQRVILFGTISLRGFGGSLGGGSGSGWYRGTFGDSGGSGSDSGGWSGGGGSGSGGASSGF